MDALGSLWIADTGNQRIRKVSAGGIVTTVAGTGAPGFSGDGASATAAQLSSPKGLSVDALGCLFLADTRQPADRERYPPSTRDHHDRRRRRHFRAKR